MDIKDRIKLIMEKEGIPSYTFAENIGVQQSTLSHIINGRNKPSLDVIMKIHQKYPDLDLEWLLYGHNDTINVTSSKNIQNIDNYPSLFSQNNAVESSNNSIDMEYRKELNSESPQLTTNDSIKQEIKYVERPSRKITEIRIYFDDNTYETFKNQK